MRELIKKRVTRFIVRYTCQICERTTETLSGVDLASDEEALRHVASHVVNGWWVGDAQEVCVICLGHAQEALRRIGIKPAKGDIPPFRKWAEYALARRQEFAREALKALELVIEDCGDTPSPIAGTPKDTFFKDMIRRRDLLRKKLGG